MGITKQYLEHFFKETADALAEAEKGTEAQITLLIKTLQEDTLENVKKACTDFAKESDVAKTRASEVRQLAGVVISMKKPALVQSLGYHAAVSAARKALKDAAMRWDGKPVMKPEATQFKRINMHAVNEATKAIQAGATVAEAQAVEEKAKAEYQNTLNQKHAEVLVKGIMAKGIDVAHYVSEMLDAAITAWHLQQSEEKHEEGQEQQQKAA